MTPRILLASITRMIYVLVVFIVQVADPELAKKAAEGGEPLRDLCRKEAANFEQYMRENEPNWGDGLERWELQILMTYLYQKIRGRVEPPVQDGNLPEEGTDGAA